mmetsp:Transcript_13172/g.48032  ORF Transcript_13172/g.48032 Transcript_13172/m.48032 type:complete len:311 (+) Transcript_13172:253-1185(+)
MRSRACMLSMVSRTASTSLPSFTRRPCIGPCSSLLTMLRLSSSTALRSFLERSPSLFSVLSSSPTRMASALDRSRLMVGTVCRESRQALNCCRSSRMMYSASLALRARASLLAATTSLRSSTLNTRASSSSAREGHTLRGTEISTYMRSGREHSSRSATMSLVYSRSSEPVEVKTTSLAAVHSSRSSIRWMSKVAAGKSAASCSARGRERLRRTKEVTPLEMACLTRRRDMVPAPMMHSLASATLLPSGIFMSTSSTAAEDTDTAPLEISVSERTRLPAMTARLKRPFRLRPKPSTPWPFWKTDLTCARI